MKSIGKRVILSSVAVLGAFWFFEIGAENQDCQNGNWDQEQNKCVCNEDYVYAADNPDKDNSDASTGECNTWYTL